MKKQFTIVTVLCSIILAGISVTCPAQRQTEKLDRGVIALKSGTSVLVKWRIFGNEYFNAGYNVYRGITKLNTTPLTGPGYYIDPDGIYDSTYTVTAVINGIEQPPSKPAPVWDHNYIDVPLQIPPGVRTPDGVTCTYSANDCSVGDLDGDGQYEIILKWDPSNSKDNSQSGYTGNVYLDAYKLDGTRLWRIDLGINIRAGAHYTQFMVYDLDGDGMAELACKTAPGTKDGSGNFLSMGPANGDNDSADYRNTSGYILSGPEYFTIFDGETGNELVTTDYIPPRGSVSSWGDSYGNRVDRFLACIAYLDGTRPSVVMCRGYYTRTVLVAWDWRDGQLTHRWTFDSNDGYPSYAGQGNHNISVADVDDDGKDEIVYGAMAVDDDGTGLWNTGLGHGDAMHVSDIDPERPGLEKWGIHEGTTTPGSALLDAHTGQILWKTPNSDVGRGVSANLTTAFEGMECWGGTVGLRSAKNAYAGSSPSSANFLVWWDSNDERELLDGITVTRYPGYTLLTANGCSSNNGTKSTPSLSADLFGDWLEEVVLRLSNSSALRIFTSPYATDRRLYTLMHEPQYRLSIAWQNVAYNQPPHTSFYLSDGVEVPPPPISAGQLTWNEGTNWDIETSKNWTLNDTSAFFHDGDNVLFDMTGSNENPIELSDTVRPSLLTVYSPTDYIFNGSAPISGTTRLEKAGSGTLTLNMDNDYTGGTSVWDGILMVNGNLSQSPVFVNRYSGIGGKGTFAKGVVMPYSGSVTVDSEGETDTLTINDSLFIGGNVRFYLDLSDDATGLTKSNDLLRINGDLILSGKSTLVINRLNDKLDFGRYNLIEFTGNFSGNLSDIKGDGLLGVPYEISGTDSSIVLEAFWVRPNATIVWNGNISGVWDQVTTINWLNSDTSDWFVQNDTVIFDDSGYLTSNIQMASILPVGKVIVDNDTVDYTFGGAGYMSGPAELIKSGSGLLNLTNYNTYTGGTSLDNGTLMISNTTGSATGTGVVEVNNGSQFAGTGITESPVMVNEGGIVAPGNSSLGIFTVNNNVTLLSGSNLNVEVNSQDNTSDRLAVAGKLNLGGILNVSRINNVAYDINDLYRILDCPDIAGGFDQIIPESPGEGMQWDTTYLRSHGYLRVVRLTAVNESEAGNFAVIYPNPVHDLATVYFPEPVNNVTIELRDLNGKVISTNASINADKVSLDLSAVTPGVYFVHIFNNELSIIKKIIKN